MKLQARRSGRSPHGLFRQLLMFHEAHGAHGARGARADRQRRAEGGRRASGRSTATVIAKTILADGVSQTQYPIS